MGGRTQDEKVVELVVSIMYADFCGRQVQVLLSSEAAIKTEQRWSEGGRAEMMIYEKE